MVVELKLFPDVEVALLDYLSPLADTYTSFPNDVASPAIRVNRTGGQVVNHITDVARVEIVSLGNTREESRLMNEQIRQMMLYISGRDCEGVLFDRVLESTAPIETPNDNQDFREIHSSYAISVRRQ